MKKSLRKSVLELAQMVANYEQNTQSVNEKMLKSVISENVLSLFNDLKHQRYEFDIQLHHIDAVKFVINSPLNKNKEKNEELLGFLTQSRLN